MSIGQWHFYRLHSVVVNIMNSNKIPEGFEATYNSYLQVPGGDHDGDLYFTLI